MISIDELIRALSPDGVNFASLTEIAMTVPGLTGKTKADFSDGNARFASYRNIFANPSLNVESPDFVKVGQGERQNSVREGDILITGSSESLDDIGMSSVVVEAPSEPIYVNSFCFILRLNEPQMLLPGFSKHLFRSESIRKQIRATASGVTRINISKSRFMKIRIPVPPLEVQREIARVLNQFSELEAELVSELEAELDARRGQFNHYRNKGLSFELETEWLQLSDVADYTNGKAHERFADSQGQAAMITARFISRDGEANRFVQSSDIRTPAAVGDVALVLSDLPSGRALARTFYVDRDNAYAINQRVARIRVIDPSRTSARFLYHYLNRNPDLLAYDNGADQTHLSKAQVTGLKFPAIPLSEQQRIAQVLDELAALASQLVSDLSTEISSRRSQYVHYRDKLLTFKEIAA